MSEPSLEIRLAIIRQEIANWENGRYLLELRHRVNKKIGGDVEAVAAELVRHEQALDALHEELSLLNQPGATSDIQANGHRS